MRKAARAAQAGPARLECSASPDRPPTAGAGQRPHRSPGRGCRCHECRMCPRPGETERRGPALKAVSWCRPGRRSARAMPDPVCQGLRRVRLFRRAGDAALRPSSASNRRSDARAARPSDTWRVPPSARQARPPRHQALRIAGRAGRHRAPRPNPPNAVEPTTTHRATGQELAAVLPVSPRAGAAPPSLSVTSAAAPWARPAPQRRGRSSRATRRHGCSCRQAVLRAP
jgi:hypothetical protein